MWQDYCLPLFMSYWQAWLCHCFLPNRAITVPDLGSSVACSPCSFFPGDVAWRDAVKGFFSMQGYWFEIFFFAELYMAQLKGLRIKMTSPAAWLGREGPSDLHMRHQERACFPKAWNFDIQRWHATRYLAEASKAPLCHVWSEAVYVPNGVQARCNPCSQSPL